MKTLAKWVMVIVKMIQILQTATMMEEIAVDLMSIQIIAHYVNALKEEQEVAEELQHLTELQLPELAIRVGLLMGIVMISTTILTVTMMVEIAVDLMLIHNIAQNACVMNKFLGINTQ